jgi:hypothetical protein
MGMRRSISAIRSSVFPLTDAIQGSSRPEVTLGIIP